jgi:hypothetical protein
MDEADQQALTGAVIKEHHLDLGQLWLEFVSLGGDASERVIRDYCAGETRLPPRERDALAQAVNEYCATEGLRLRVPFSDSVLSRLHPEGPDSYSSK